MYFDLKLQTETKTYRSVCFSPEKHKEFKEKVEASSPVKISRYTLKRNTMSEADEIFINKRTKLDELSEHEIKFAFQNQGHPSEEESEISDVLKILKGDTSNQVNVCGRITFNNTQETIMTKGKALKKQDASFTDETGTMRLVLWEKGIQAVKSASTYELAKVMVRSYQNEKYLMINRNTTVKLTDTIIVRKDPITMASNINKVSCPVNGVKSLQRFACCNSCKTKIVPVPNKKIVQCSECSLTQMMNKCQSTLYANVLFADNETSTVTLILFENKLKCLHKLFIQQNPHFSTQFEKLDDEQLMEIILTVEATVTYNEKGNVVAIKEKDD